MSEKHRILVVGAGSIGERHARCFLQTGRAFVSICESDAKRAEEVRGRYPLEAVHPRLEEALEAPWDAAVVATPAHLHIEHSLALASRGAHLLIEKPLSTRVEGVDELVSLVRSSRRIAAVAYVYRAHPVLAAMREALRGGRFGRPLEVVVVAGQHFPTYRPAYREIYYRDRGQGGGAIQDALTHLVNAVEWIVGPVERLVADASHQALDGVDVEDTVHLLTRHGDVLGSFALNQHQPANEMVLTVICERGEARFELHRGRWCSMRSPGESWREESRVDLERDDLFVFQAEDFLDVLERKREPLCNLEEGLQTLRVNVSALASAEERAWKETS